MSDTWDKAIEALFTKAAFEAAFEAALDQPYTRLGYPSYLLLTAAQWANYDAFEALWDKTDRQYGRFVPQTAAVLRNAGRSVW